MKKLPSKLNSTLEHFRQLRQMQQYPGLNKGQQIRNAGKNRFFARTRRGGI